MKRLYWKLRSLREKVEYLQAESARWKAFFGFFKAPYSLLRTAGFSPRMAVTALFVLFGAGSGVVVNETILSGYSFSRGDPGVYAAPGDSPLVYIEGSNTLLLNLGVTPVGEITIENVTVGTAYAGSALPDGETDAVFIGGVIAAGTYLEVGHLIVDRWRCDSLVLTNIDVHTLNVSYNASDGQSIGPVAGTPRARGIGGGNRADSMQTSGGYYDQIKIQAPNSGVNGKVDVLTLRNILSKGGPCTLSFIKAGIIDIIYNEVGNGDGFSLKDFVIQPSVEYKNFVNLDNVEVVISPP